MTEPPVPESAVTDVPVTDLVVEQLCPGCRRAVFDGRRIVRCTKCAVFHHEPCWTKEGRCRGSDGCRGKPQDVVVVRVPHAGPTLDEIATEVERRVHASLEPVLESIYDQIPSPKEFAKLEVGMVDLRSGIVEAVASSREEMASSIRTLQRTITEERTRGEDEDQAGAAAMKATLDDVSARLQELSRDGADHVERVVRSGTAELLAEIRSTLDAVEACRWAVDSARHPLPWQDGPVVTDPVVTDPVAVDPSAPDSAAARSDA